jgi:transposase
LKELTDRIQRTPDNSSVPPSSRAPWNKGKSNAKPAELEEEEDERRAAVEKVLADDEPRAEPESPENAAPVAPAQPVEGKKAAGKQPGSPGYGRTQVLAITAVEKHLPSQCAVCGAALGADTVFRPYTAWDQVEIVTLPAGESGFKLEVTRHEPYEGLCGCGHRTRMEPYRAESDGLWEKVALGEWRLIGPTLAGLIVYLKLSMRLSLTKIQAFFHDVCGLELSVGVLSQCLLEAGRAAHPLEAPLVEELRQSALLYVDETSWWEGPLFLWLWVFTSQDTVMYFIGSRGAEILTNTLGPDFDGEAMTDGWQVYRALRKRLRCWAHWVRKARGLRDSSDRVAATVGSELLDLLEGLIDAVLEARGQNLALGTLEKRHADPIARLKALCEQYRNATHKKLGEFAREMLNDWAVILRPLHDPRLPLTNNEAERALRHWVIARLLSQGTRSGTGSRALALLAGLIDTCRKRGVSCWRYLGQVIAAARKGLALPPLPPPLAADTG